MDATTLATIALAVVGVLGVIAATLGWVYKRGGEDRALADNTAATRELTIELREFKTATVDKLHDHDKRLTVLETAKDGS